MARWVGLGCIGVVMLACSPTYNWRLVRPADFGLQALLPCKPQAAQRTVALGEQSAQLHMLSCETAGLTFAVSALRVPVGVDATTVLMGWKQASLASLKVPVAQAQDWLPSVPRVTGAKGWQAEGVRHDGSPVKAHVLMLVHGSEVFQVAVYGTASPEVLTELLEGLRLDAVP